MSQPEDKVLLTGIGTLLLRESLGDTVSQENAGTKKFTPVIIEGYKRLFNVGCTHYPVENRMGHGPIEFAAANVEPAPGHSLNGLAFWVDRSELADLDKRERYYERATANCLDFITGEDMGECHVYMSPLDADWVIRDITKLLPLWRDIQYARVGAYRISPTFGHYYDETTFLADGKTYVVDFYQDHLEELSKLDR